MLEIFRDFERCLGKDTATMKSAKMPKCHWYFGTLAFSEATVRLVANVIILGDFSTNRHFDESRTDPHTMWEKKPNI